MTNRKKAFLILEDGTVWQGNAIGAQKEVISEIVFNTSMTGYLEVLTDPSYAGQAVTMTYPLIGNYGVCLADMESHKAWPDAWIVRELSPLASNFRQDMSLEEFLIEQDIPGICGIDTRALTKVLRKKGTMNGMITTDERYYSGERSLKEALNRIRNYRVEGVVELVSRKTKEKYLPGDLGTDSCPVTHRVAVVDLGVKNNILRCLLKRGCEVTVYPYNTKANEIAMDHPDGIMLTNGPGDPKECAEVISQLRQMIQMDIPIFAICLGHQLMALANGFDTHKMKYGHRGANHPVRESGSKRVYISSQNHGYVVSRDSIDTKIASVSFENVNDETVEGLTYYGKNIMTVQFHPEACAGPQDSEILFDRFLDKKQNSLQNGDENA